MADDLLAMPVDYEALLGALKQRIQTAQLRAALAVNRELVMLYWQIGREILAQQRRQGWGARVIDRLARDLRQAFPELKGFSPRNLKYMRAFAEAWPDEAIVQQLAAQRVRAARSARAHRRRRVSADPDAPRVLPGRPADDRSVGGETRRGRRPGAGPGAQRVDDNPPPAALVPSLRHTSIVTISRRPDLWARRRIVEGRATLAERFALSTGGRR